LGDRNPQPMKGSFEKLYFLFLSKNEMAFIVLLKQGLGEVNTSQ